MPTKEEFNKLVKHYFSLMIFSCFCFFVANPLKFITAVGNNNVIEFVKLHIQSIIVSQEAKAIIMFVLLLCTAFVVAETFIVMRNCVQQLYLKYKRNSVMIDE